MRRQFLPAFLLLAACLTTPRLHAEKPTGSAAVTASIGQQTDISELMRERIRQIEEQLPALMEEQQVPGVSVALIDGGQIVWSQGFGLRSADGTEPVDRETVMEACSMSKPFFAYIVLKLVEQGKFDLQTPLVDLLGQDYLEDDPRHRKITGLMTLTHTSGLPNWREGGWRSGNPLTLGFEPGTKFRYSGEGFLMLQRAIEKQLQTDCDTLSQEMLISPLNLTRTRYVWDEHFQNNFAAGHDAQGKVKTSRRYYSRANSAYSLYTTSEDYARFLLEVMTPDRSGEQSLSEVMREKMLTVHSHRQEQEADWGLGWGLKTRDGRTFVYHSGSNGTGFRCYSEFNVEDQQGLVIMTNGVNGRSVWQPIVENWHKITAPATAAASQSR